VVGSEHDTVHVAVDAIVHDGDLSREVRFERRAVPVDIDASLSSLGGRAGVHRLPEGVRLPFGDDSEERPLPSPAGGPNKSQTSHTSTEAQRKARDQWRVTSD